MLRPRWQQILDTRPHDIALHHSTGTLTFAGLQRAAEQLSASDLVIAQGTGLQLITALVAALWHDKPVQIVEADRQPRTPACPLPAGTALIKQTVGASGLRRCQFFTAEQILADTDRLHIALGLDRVDCILCAISPAHSYGLTVAILQTVLNGVPLHVLDVPFPAPLGQAIQQHERPYLPGIPALWRAWQLARLPLHRLTLATSAGSPLTLALEHDLYDTHGVKLHNLYGTSEAGAIACDLTETPRTEATLLGTLLPGVKASHTADGHLVAQSDAVGLGYDAPEITEHYEQGTFLTCDQTSLRDNGELHLHDCTGMGINVAGRKLSPGEIAAKLEAATGVTGICIYGFPSRDPERCEEIVANVPLPAADLTPAFRQQATSSLAPWEIPRRWTSCTEV